MTDENQTGVVHVVASSPRLREAVNTAAQGIGVSVSALFRIALAHYVHDHPQVEPQIANELISAASEIPVRAVTRKTVEVQIPVSAAAWLPQATPTGEP